MRLALIHVAQETNDFNPRADDAARLRGVRHLRGPEIVEKLRGARPDRRPSTEAVDEAGLAIETIPIIRAWAVAGGRITRDAFDFFEERIRARPRGGRTDRRAGAAAPRRLRGRGHRRRRGRAGRRSAARSSGPTSRSCSGSTTTPTSRARWSRCSTAIVGHRTQPHDPFDTGRIGTRAPDPHHPRARLKPVTAWRKIPLLSHQEQFLTSQGPMKIWFDRARAHGGRSARAAGLELSRCSPGSTSPRAAGRRSSSPTATGRSPSASPTSWPISPGRCATTSRSARRCRSTRRCAWPMRRSAGVVVLSDTGDTVFGGAAGDSNLILEAMLRLGIKGRGARAADRAEAPCARLAEAGEGATVTLPLGGDAGDRLLPPDRGDRHGAQGRRRRHPARRTATSARSTWAGPWSSRSAP